MITEKTEFILKEGYGSKYLHLGMGVHRLMKEFNPPQEKRRASLRRVYWLFHSRGFDCIISAHTKRLLSIFFYARGCDGHSGAKARTLSGVTFGDAASKVRRIYGHPSKSAGGFTTQTGDYVRAWYSYRTGIGFHFGRHDNVEIISIFRPSNVAARRRDRPTLGRVSNRR